MSRSPSLHLPTLPRVSSPPTDDYHTASSFDPKNEALNSTFAFNHTLTQQFPAPQQHYSRMSEAGSDQFSQGSAEMSIELGRGLKRASREQDISDDAVFTFRSGEEYGTEMYGTPQPKQRNVSARKEQPNLRRQASSRQASQATKPNDSVKRATSDTAPRHANLADAIKDIPSRVPSYNDTIGLPSMPVASRNTRFTKPKNVSSNHNGRVLSGSTLEGSNPETKDNGRPTSSHNNATVQSETFLLPDVDGITQLVGATPSMPRSSKRSTRFTPSATYRMPSRSNVPDLRPVSSVPVDDDARRVYVGLKEALTRIAELEMDQEDRETKILDHEATIADLRNQLEIEERTHRPDSGLGSEDEREKSKWRRERAQLQTQVKSLQDRLNRSERQARNHEATVHRVTQEKAEIVSQIEVHLYSLEETKVENNALRDEYEKLQYVNEDLQEMIEALREENQKLKGQNIRAQSKKAQLDDMTLNMPRSSKPAPSHVTRPSQQQEPTMTQRTKTQTQIQTKDFTFSQLDTQARDNITRLVQQELRRVKDAAAAKSRAAVQRQEDAETWNETLSRSKTRNQRQPSQIRDRRSSNVLNGRRAASAPVESSASEAESESEAELTGRTRQTLHDMNMPGPIRARSVKEDTRNLTNLSMASMGTQEIRQYLEQQRKTRHASLPLMSEKEPTLTQQAALRRKSSLKDATVELTGSFSTHGGAAEEPTRVPKSVRVQSPHTIDEIPQPANIDDSILSNTSRRRRSAIIPDNEKTSAYLLPDLTFVPPTPAPKNTTVRPHKSTTCTICASVTNTHINIPLPIPVSSRDLGEDATVRPAWAPHLSLAHVLKQLEDEVAHLNLQLASKNAELAAHDPALGRRRRVSLTADVQKLMGEMEKRSEMVYRLYDVVESQEAALAAAARSGDPSRAFAGAKAAFVESETEVEETLMSVGMDPVEVSGRLGRCAPEALPEGLREECEDGEESEELPWEGLSDGE